MVSPPVSWRLRDACGPHVADGGGKGFLAASGVPVAVSAGGPCILPAVERERPGVGNGVVRRPLAGRRRRRQRQLMRARE
ncbi:MAG: hypothetical protein ABF665_20450, partial [Gluconacetobacter sp.]